MKINSRHYILIVFAILTVGVSAYCYFFLYKHTTSQADNYLNNVKQVEVEKNSVDYEQKLIETFNKYEEDRTKIESYIIKEDELVPFIEKIEKIGTDSKVDLEISSIANIDSKIKAKVTATGSWQGVMTSLLLIENLPISLSVSNVRLDTSGDVEKETTTSTVAQKVREWRLSLDIEVLTTK